MNEAFGIVELLSKVHILSIITFLPLLAAAIIIFIPSNRHEIIKTVAAVFSGLSLLLGILVYILFDGGSTSLQFVEKFRWISKFNIYYYVGVDGLSISMILLTVVISFVAVFASWGIKDRVKAYFALLMLLETAMLGVFIALDFFLFYVFWELMLLPMYFLIGIWGGPRREYAAIKFFLYTLAGSALMLLAMIALYYAGGRTFDLVKLANDFDFSKHAPLHLFGMTLPFAKTLFIALFIGFAIKIPMFPFHTWLPDAHVEAPTAISVILAGVLLKMGTYGIFRINYAIFPHATEYFAYAIAFFGVINIVYGALVAMAQEDFKKLIAYSSISHMGIVLLGMATLTPIGMNGALLEMFNHGTITAMLFLSVGVIYDRAHHRDLYRFGGLAKQMPVYAAWTAFAFFAAMGLPGLSGFVSEALSYLGGLKVFPALTVIGATGIIFTAGYLLWTIQRVFLGPLNEKYATLPDINGREIFTMALPGFFALVIGWYPQLVLGKVSVFMIHLIDVVTKAKPW